MRFQHALRACAIVPFVVLGACASTEPQANPAAASREGGTPEFSARPIEGAEATIVVRGLSCPKCANNVNLQLGKVEGVGETHIDMGAGEVRVVFDTLAPVNPSRAALARAITDAGFTVVDVRTP